MNEKINIQRNDFTKENIFISRNAFRRESAILLIERRGILYNDILNDSDTASLINKPGIKFIRINIQLTVNIDIKNPN